jgi:hypothetical protein
MAISNFGGLSHTQRIQTLRYSRQLIFARHGLDLWGRILECVAVADVGPRSRKFTPFHRW